MDDVATLPLRDQLQRRGRPALHQRGADQRDGRPHGEGLGAYGFTDAMGWGWGERCDAEKNQTLPALSNALDHGRVSHIHQKTRKITLLRRLGDELE